MKKSSIDRREFLKRSIGGAATVWGGLAAGGAARAAVQAAWNARGLPTRVLGRTGVAVPRIGIGLGSRFCAVADPEAAQRILLAALDHGFYYWDTASSYRVKDIVSEERIGRVLEKRRGEVFIATKCESRTYDEVLREFEESLKRLRTDRVDLYQIHLIQSRADVDAIGLRNGALRAFHKLKEEKAVRFIGFTGHLDAEAMTEAARRYDFDTMLIALNHYQGVRGDLEKAAMPAAKAKGMGVMAIKVIRPKETVAGVDPAGLIRYALSLDAVDSAVIGTDSVAVVEKNAALLKSFAPLGKGESARMEKALEPFFQGRDLPWMDPAYKD